MKENAFSTFLGFKSNILTGNLATLAATYAIPVP